MAHRIITAVFLSGSRILGRAVTEAYRQAQSSQKLAQAASKNPSALRTHQSGGLSLEEACKILDVPPPKLADAGAAAAGGKVREEEMGRVLDRFRRMFDTNDPKNGGSFYLQSKILRARQRIEAEMQAKMTEAEAAKVREKWKT